MENVISKDTSIRHYLVWFYFRNKHSFQYMFYILDIYIFVMSVKSYTSSLRIYELDMPLLVVEIIIPLPSQ